MKLRTPLLAAFAATALLLTGCTGGGGSSDGPESGAALTIAKPDGSIVRAATRPP